ASRTAFLISFVLIAVNTIAAPKFAALYHKGDMEALGSIARHSAKLMAIFASPVLLLFLIFPGWVMAIFGSQYADHGLILAVLAIGQFINVATGSVGYLLVMTGNERLQLYGISAVTVVSIVLYLTLIPAFGITGAAIATGVSVASQNLLACYLVYRALGIKTIPWPGLKFR
ncbi:MAG: polysaccharide biosynthesis C-terminal domain-containing protein, partial [Deltaproteobacteria bacterium]|nr:polysaccharide biosynthesis C-terminal domain-containing protein [Deltaproteobacteria bacterium]